MKRLILLIAFGLFLASCDDDRNIDERERYLIGVDIIQLPNLQYDSDGSPPDLRVDLKRRSTNFWEFSTYVRNNANRLPVFLQFPSEILATDEFYEISLVDEDLNELSDDVIFTWEFQAVLDGEDGIIEFFDNNELVMVLEYELK